MLYEYLWACLSAEVADENRVEDGDQGEKRSRGRDVVCNAPILPSGVLIDARS